MLKDICLPFSIYLVIGVISGIYFFNFKKFYLLIILLSSLILFIYKNISIINFNLFLISILAGHCSYHKQISDFYRFKKQIDQKIFDITGKLVDYEKKPENFFKHKLTVQVELFSSQTEKLAVSKNIYIYTQKFPAVYVGEKIILENLRFNFPANKHFEQFLIKNNVAATVFIPTLNFKKIASPKNNLVTFLKKYKCNLLKKINLKMNSATKTMFNSIFLGKKTHNKTQFTALRDNFQAWGIIHYLARSGLHLVIIGAIWQFFCNALRLSFISSNIIILLLMLIFYLLSWQALPFIRALIMIVCYRICRFYQLQIHVLHILNLSCIIILLSNPIALFFLDFQLSFVLTYGLVFLNELSHLKRQLAPKYSIAYKNQKLL